MWRAIALTFLLLGLAGFGEAQSTNATTAAGVTVAGDAGGGNGTTGGGNDTTGGGNGTTGAGGANGTAPAGGALGGNGTNSTSCQHPDPLLHVATGAPTTTWINEQRTRLQQIKPQNSGACGIQPLRSSATLAQRSYEVAMTCPTTAAGPGMPQFTSAQGIGQIVVYMEPSQLPTSGHKWMELITNMSDTEWRLALGRYSSGPWDPIFQVLWAATTEVGTAMVRYNNSDFATLSRLFNRNVSAPMTLVSIVSTFSPAGCVAGEIPWRFCGGITMQPGGSSSSDRPDEPPGPPPGPGPDPNPGEDPDPGKKDTPQGGGGTRIGGELGFNFATVSISSIMMGNLMRFLLPNFVT